VVLGGDGVTSCSRGIHRFRHTRSSNGFRFCRLAGATVWVVWPGSCRFRTATPALDSGAAVSQRAWIVAGSAISAVDGLLRQCREAQLLSMDLQQQLLREDPFEDIARYVRQSGLIGDFQRLLYLCMKLYFQDDILVKVDRASMAHSLEVRVPYMDRDLLEYACRIQPFYKLRGLTTKYVLKRALRRFLPREVIHRRKAGFMMPVAVWLTREMRETVLDQCSPAAVASTDCLILSLWSGWSRSTSESAAIIANRFIRCSVSWLGGATAE